MKKFLESLLANCARWTLARNKPQIIGITGSVGKTSTKDAIALVLSQKFQVGSSTGNLNSQLGLPLAILGFSEAGGFKKNLSTFFDWLGILVLAFFRVFRPNYPKILVVEMGTDRPGDIAYLLGIVGHLDAAVITDIGISHLEFFQDQNALAGEKLSILEGLDEHGFAILNSDNPKVLAGRSRTRAKVRTFGFNTADFQAEEYKFTQRSGQPGVEFTVSYDHDRVKFFIPNAIGRPAVLASLAASAIAVSMGMSLTEVARALEQYRQPAGRLRLIAGANSTTIVDDTYNAAPSSTIAAIDALVSVPSSRHIAVLGQMAELGSASELGHTEVGSAIAASNLDLVFLVGEKTKPIAQEQLNFEKFKDKVFWFATSDEAKSAVKQNLLPGDVVLVKGSQSARMEKIVKEIMAEPDTAEKLLVRQSKQWLEA